MKLRVAIQIIILACWMPVCSFAQSNSANHNISVNIPEVALLGLVSNGSTDINLTAQSPSRAGNTIDVSNAQNSDIWINYSSIITRTSQRRKVIAMVQGEIPRGLHLLVEASDVAGTGKGKLGVSEGYVALSNEPSDVIVDIGSCYTGKGINNGHFLKYKIETDESDNNFTLLSQQQASVNVIYTLTDQN